MDAVKREAMSRLPKENALRVNVVKDAPRRTLPSGRAILAKPIRSETFRSGPLFDAVKRMLPGTTHVTLNKNFASQKHRDKKNQGRSAIALFGPFTGGALMVQEPTGLRRITEKDRWHFFNGARDEHWVEPFKGDRWSVVAYKQDSPKKK